MVTLSRVMTSWCGNFENFLAQGDANHLIERPEDQSDAGAFGNGQCAAKTKDHGAFVFAKDLDGVEEVEHDDGDNNQNRNGQIGSRHGPFLLFGSSGGIVLQRLRVLDAPAAEAVRTGVTLRRYCS